MADTIAGSREERLALLHKQYIGLGGEPTAAVIDDLTSLRPEADFFQRIRNDLGDNFLKDNKVMPLFIVSNKLTVAMADPGNIQIIDQMRNATGLDVEPMVALAEDIDKALDRLLQTGQAEVQVPDLPDEDEDVVVEPGEEEERQVLGSDEKRKLEEQAGESKVVRYVNELIVRAVKQRASDIHIVPTREGISVLMRIDGVLRVIIRPKKALSGAVTSRIKIMSKMNIAEKRVPQDGRYGAFLGGREVDFRVSTFPNVWGEVVVMRVLDRQRLLTLKELGMRKDDLTIFEQMIARPNGVILITGPTGSGKSTTIYAVLKELAPGTESDEVNNIMTVEDPVEYELDSIRQSAVNERAGYTYLTALKSILRQDPDILMIGEIRDSETAGTAMRIALTGQLVFSTLHTTDAPGAIPRLINMGTPEFEVSSALQGVVAQRLVRTLCPDCKTLFDSSKHDHNPQALKHVILPARQVGLDLTQYSNLYFGAGCAHCRQTGYVGRLGLFEIMVMTDRIREVIPQKLSVSILRQLAREGGMKTLWEDGMVKVSEGLTTLEEVTREAAKPEGAE
ncbi:MAG: GspE/PulE family protein [Candidatus Parcubacteria bacterium]|nr:GspE/PulE family protein [Candidatus Parcubacteria bacterium]